MATDDIRSQEWITKIEELVRRAETLSDPNVRAITVDLLQGVLDFHAAALGRILEILVNSGTAGKAIIEQMAGDDLTGSMLLLHDLHPDDLETRVRRAVDKLQDMFASLGAQLSLAAIEPGVVRLSFESSRAWPGTAARTSIENVIFQAAPEIETVTVEGLKEPAAPGFVPVSDLLAGVRQ